MAAPPLPAAGAERAAGESRRAGAPGVRGDKGRDTRSPPPALVPLLSCARGNLPVPPHPRPASAPLPPLMSPALSRGLLLLLPHQSGCCCGRRV